jgi:pyruvate-formate lyase
MVLIMNEYYSAKIDSIRKLKLKQTEEKIRRNGRNMNGDDKGLIPYDGEFSFKPEYNHPKGVMGPEACGRNYRRLLESHPVYIDPCNALPGGWMFSFASFKGALWNDNYSYDKLAEEQKVYDIISGIGACHHFMADIKIGLKLGLGGILNKIHHYRDINDPARRPFYNALEDCVLGIQNIILRHADEAERLAEAESDPDQKLFYSRMADCSRWIAANPPRSFYEAIMFTSWFILTLDMYNGAGAAVGEIDQFLYPYYKKDKSLGLITDDEVVYLTVCLFVKDNFYAQIGGSRIDGSDKTNELSFLILEATHQLKIPTSLCVRVHEQLNPELLYRAVEYLFQDKNGTPSFIGDKGLNEGFVRNGYPMELAVTRARAGCHWLNIPGREYTLNDCVKINFVKVFEVAFHDMLDNTKEPSTDLLWEYFKKHLVRAVDLTIEGIEFHLKYMEESFPELPMDLFCYGPIEKGYDASNGFKRAVEYYNMCIDGSGLAVVADSFAAIKQRVEEQRLISWQQLIEVLENDFEGSEDIRLMLRSNPRYGSGGSLADEYAVEIVRHFVFCCKKGPTPSGFVIIPGLFSWSNTIGMGKVCKATPDGRHAGAPISHGANPTPGFREAGALTALANAVASVQCGYGNTVPVQIEVDPKLGADEGGIEIFVEFIKTYFNTMKGTLMNLNIINKDTILAAHENPENFPDLIVRVTGFSAYFAALSRDFRQLVVDRIIEGA